MSERPRFVYHDLDFETEAPVGYAPCRKCGRLIRDGGFFTDSCLGRSPRLTYQEELEVRRAADHALMFPPPIPVWRLELIGVDFAEFGRDRTVVMRGGVPHDCVACVFCGTPVRVEEPHREQVRRFGAVCDECWRGMAAVTLVELRERRTAPRPEAFVR